MRKPILALLTVFLFTSLSHSIRGPKDKLSTPMFKDPTNRSEITSVNVGTTTAQKLNTPRASKIRDERALRIQNPSTVRNLLISTWAVPSSQVSFSTDPLGHFTIRGTSSTTDSYIDLSPSTTYYGRYEQGGSSIGVKIQVDFNDYSGNE